MDKVNILKSAAVISLIGILFTPLGSDYWKFLLFLGVVFGIFWFVKS